MATATGKTAAEVARIVSRAVGRTVTAKQVRAYGRAHIARLDDDRYTPTAYTAAEVARIVAHFRATRARSDAQTERPARKRSSAPTKGTRAQRAKAAVAESAESADAPDAIA